MSLGRVVVTDSGPLLAPGIAWLRARGVEVEVLAGGDPSAKVAALSTADAALVGVEAFTATEMAAVAAAGAGPRFVIRCGVGYDVIDVEAATRHGMRVANVPDYCTDEVADHSFALLLAAARGLPYFLSAWRTERKWDWGGGGQPVPRLADLTLGIVGAGRIGRAVATRARGFGMKLLAADPRPPAEIETVPLHELLARSDVVTLHCPYTAATHHLLNDDAFRQMKPGSILVNTSRGGVVDSAALERGLERNQPAGAALDVLEGEPVPDLEQPLLRHPRVLVTPHVAYYSVASLQNLGVFAAQNVFGFLNGEAPRHVVNDVLAAVTP
ncbi:MAG: C-terminal binding protein [Chloroflexi bacterium]|nr:C-terminal binding protein [Chloroflexota bacterium]